MRAKRASENETKIFREEIKKILENPLLTVPECIDGGFLCPFNNYRKKLYKNVDLSKFDKSGDEFLRALAETSRAVNSDLRYSGQIKTQFGIANFFRKGDSDQYVLAGIQNWENDIFRMLSFSRIVNGNRAIIYSAGNYFKASCKFNPPENEFTEELKNREFQRDHLIDNYIKAGDGKISLSINLMGRKIIETGTSSRKNSLSMLLKHIFVKNPEKFVSLRVDYLEEFYSNLEIDYTSKYFRGEISDSDYIDSIVKIRIENGAKNGRFICNGIPYNSLDDLMKHIGIEENLRAIISEIWKKDEGIILETPSKGKFLEYIWPEKGLEILKRLFPKIPIKEIENQKGMPYEIIEKLKWKDDWNGVNEKIKLETWSESSRFYRDCIYTAYLGNMDRLSSLIHSEGRKSKENEAVEYAFEHYYGLKSSNAYDDETKIRGEIVLNSLKKIAESNYSDITPFYEIKYILR
ncbi:hypothetical protein [Caldiplasma sukawensis]